MGDGVISIRFYSDAKDDGTQDKIVSAIVKALLPYNVECLNQTNPHEYAFGWESQPSQPQESDTVTDTITDTDTVTVTDTNTTNDDNVATIGYWKQMSDIYYKQNK